MDHTNDIIVGLDIGTTKICALVGRRNEYGKIEVLGMGKSESLGVMRGVVANIEKTVDSIHRAVEAAATQASVDIESVTVGIAGQHIKSIQHNGLITRQDGLESEISQEDLDRLKGDMTNLVIDPGDKIIHVLPQEYIVDGESGIKDPKGMAGVRLGANFHIITGQVSAIKNIDRCVTKSGLEVSDLVLEPLASSEAVLSAEEKEAGVALIDIGGGTTDVAIFQDGIIRHTAVIPFGGNIITEDVKSGCNIMKTQAEQLKVYYGSALPDETSANEIVSIQSVRGREPKEISIKNLSHIINARVEEIMEAALYEIKASNFHNQLIAGIVLTGGGSQLKHLKQLVEYMSGMETRIGYPTEHLAPSPIADIKDPLYATGVGLMVKGFEELDKGQRKPSTKSGKKKGSKNPFWSSWLTSHVEKGREWLEQDAENDYE